MQAGEELHRGVLGVGTDPAFLGPGAKLATVAKDSVAYRAKIRKGQVVTEVDGIKVTNGFHLQMLVGKKMAGDPVQLKVRKSAKEDAEEFGTTVFLEKVSSAEMAAKEPDEDIGVPLPGENK
jgi:S1-C subfamily serine protease